MKNGEKRDELSEMYRERYVKWEKYLCGIKFRKDLKTYFGLQLKGKMSTKYKLRSHKGAPYNQLLLSALKDIISEEEFVKHFESDEKVLKHLENHKPAIMGYKPKGL